MHGVCIAWARHGHGMGTAWARHGHGVCIVCGYGMGTAWAWHLSLRSPKVVMHGNDLCVADIPGILVFAVNHRRERVPLNAHIMIPHTLLQGPEATDAILRQLHLLTADLLCK